MTLAVFVPICDPLWALASHEQRSRLIILRVCLHPPPPLTPSCLLCYLTDVLATLWACAYILGFLPADQGQASPEGTASLSSMSASRDLC